MREMLFQRGWWLDAVAPHGWDEVQVQDGGEVVGRWPFVCEKRQGLTVLTQSPLARTLGPWLSYSETRPDRRMAQHQERLDALVEQLPRFDLLRQGCSPEFMNWLPLYWRGFTETTLYTYRLEELENLEEVRGGFRKALRGDLKRVEGRLEVRESGDVEVLWRLSQQPYQRQGVTFPFPLALVERVYRACAGRDAGKILVAVDETGHVHAADFYAWDEHTMYALMGSRNSTRSLRGAHTLLTWHALQDAARRGLAFDFQGSVLEGIEEYVRGFGGQLTPYSQVGKSSWRRRALRSTQSALEGAVRLLRRNA